MTYHQPFERLIAGEYVSDEEQIDAVIAFVEFIDIFKHGSLIVSPNIHLGRSDIVKAFVNRIMPHITATALNEFKFYFKLTDGETIVLPKRDE